MWSLLSTLQGAKTKVEAAGIPLNPLGWAGAGMAAGAALMGVSNTNQRGNTMASATLGRGIIDIPGIDVNWGNILPGGEPFIVNEGAAGFQYSHTANGTVFYRAGNWMGCYKKNGQWKQWHTYHPTVFGKRDDPRKLAKIIKRHHGAWKELNRVFGKRHKVEYIHGKK